MKKFSHYFLMWSPKFEFSRPKKMTCSNDSLQNTFVTVVDTTDNVYVESGCQTQDNAFSGEDVTVCICSGNYCNAGQMFQMSFAVLFLALVFLMSS